MKLDFRPIHKSRNAFVFIDQRITRFMNRSCSLKGVEPFFAVVSSLGDGKGWYALMALLPFIAGTRGLYATLHLLVAGGITLPVYKLIKTLTRRARPCNALEEIRMGGKQLDEYSFPSGHVMHAVAFSVVLTAWFPAAATVMTVVVVLVALSRIVLGLHYPTDVALGAVLGFWLASLSMPLFSSLIQV